MVKYIRSFALIKLNRKFCKTAIRTSMFYDAKCWAINKQKISVAKISVAKMKILRWIRLASIDQRLRKSCLR